MASGHQPILDATASQGFIAPATIATAFALQERLLIIAIMRLGGELFVPGLAESLGQEAGFKLDAEIDADGTFVVRTTKVVDGE